MKPSQVPCCRVHDTDANNKLDGLELHQSLRHGVDAHIVNMQKKEKQLEKDRITRLYSNIESKQNLTSVKKTIQWQNRLHLKEKSSSRRTLES